MLHINDVTFRIEGKTILEAATAAIPAGHKVGLVGRNGAGKSTLLKLIAGDLPMDTGSISMPRNARLGMVLQEAPGGEESLLETVLAADAERASLIAEAETASDPHRISEIHIRLTDIDAHGAPARAAQILSGLGFSPEAQARPCSSFSGGWRMRVALARMLFLKPDILLLDEPTNYLDLEGTLWLEAHLKTYPYTVIIVSHDRDLLNEAVTAILHLEKKRLFYYTGNYDQFEEVRRLRQANDLKLKAKQAAERKRLEGFIERFKAKASKASQAQSRVKALARMQPIAAEVEGELRRLAFPSPTKLSPPLLKLDEVSLGYSPETPVLRKLTLRIDTDDRIALLGANGNGKSTFAKYLAGRLEPLEGHSRRNKKMKVGYFAQHQLDVLRPADTPLGHVRERMAVETTEAQARSKTASLGFGADLADAKVGTLSGGEKARLLLGLITMDAPHLLILDEPTNHLDVDMREALVQAINDYDGAVVLISHDRHLVNACADDLWLVDGGGVAPYAGDLDEYAKLIVDSRTRTAGNGAERGPSVKAEKRRAAADRRAELGPLRAATQSAEAQIAKLTEDLGVIDRALAVPGLFEKDPARATRYAKKRAEIEAAIARAEEAWLDAQAALEAATAE